MMNERENPPCKAPVAVIGAGPAGLAAAYELTRRGVPVIVFEQDGRIGGLAQTIEHKGFRFDIGGHRFFTKQKSVLDLWRSLLGDELLERLRLSHIIYRERLFDYPLKPLNTLRNLGLTSSLLILASYARGRLFPISPERSLADWVTNRFGRRLYRMFFKTYTEKVWGVPCSEIGARWAAQRIKGLSLRTAVFSMLFPVWRGEIRTLTDHFYYPRLGPGMMWDALRERIVAGGGEVRLLTRVTGVVHEGGRVRRIVVRSGEREESFDISHVISSMPLRQLFHALDPAPSSDIAVAAGRLRYRDFLTVALIIDATELFPDNWLYIHDETVRVGRIQNFGNWSAELVPDRTRSCLGMEYFCFEGDGLWTMADRDLVGLAAAELTALGIAPREKVVEGVVVRMPKAYPVYDEGFEETLTTLREYLERFGNLQQVGRNGMHRYNNMDHSMLTGLLAAANLTGKGSRDLWAVNDDDEYYEKDTMRGGDDASHAVEAQCPHGRDDPLTQHGHLRQAVGRSGGSRPQAAS